MKRFRDLTPAQLRVFEQVACNNDKGHNPATLEKLVAAGLIEETGEEWPGDGWGVFRVMRYSVPIGVHMEWCAWCAENMQEVEG